MISISIVSHGQMHFVRNLLDDLQVLRLSTQIEVLLTLNIPDEQEGDILKYSFPIFIIRNHKSIGFGKNHNQAFRLSNGEFFCVLNPDIRLVNEPFEPLVNCLSNHEVGVAAPLVLGPNKEIEESARCFPSPFGILFKLFRIKTRQPYLFEDAKFYSDWVAGMFMLFRSDVYRRINGFDERYFLYYEDVDICARLKNNLMKVVLCSDSKVVHLAQRTSHRNFRYLRWHITSMVRFFISAAYWRLLCR